MASRSLLSGTFLNDRFLGIWVKVPSDSTSTIIYEVAPVNRLARYFRGTDRGKWSVPRLFCAAFDHFSPFLSLFLPIPERITSQPRVFPSAFLARNVIVTVYRMIEQGL